MVAEEEVSSPLFNFLPIFGLASEVLNIASQDFDAK